MIPETEKTIADLVVGDIVWCSTGTICRVEHLTSTQLLVGGTAGRTGRRWASALPGTAGAV